MNSVKHSVEWTMTTYGPEATFRCYADLDDFCHQGCRAGVCEQWSSDGCDHGLLVSLKRCLVLEWLNNDCDTCYVGPDTALRSGPVEVTWNGDCYDWKYAEAVTS